MGPQDGVDVVLAAAEEIIHRRGRHDIAFTLMGRGDCWWDLVAERDRRDLGGHVELPGRVTDAELAAVLSTADLGLSPDPLNPLNDLSTMNKTMEYMAFGLPVLAFDLVETRVSAGNAAAYADPRCADPIGAYADLLLALIDDPARRVGMGVVGMQRVEQSLAWSHQAPTYRRVYDELTGRTGQPDHVVVPISRAARPTQQTQQTQRAPQTRPSAGAR
jgi:glycosyltransferase involved in cell wall biosynthesis